MDMGPKLLNVVLYEYFSVFLNRPFKNFTLKGMKKNHGSKVALSREPSKDKKVQKNKDTEPNVFPKLDKKCDFEPFLVK